MPIEWQTVETQHERPTRLAWTTVEGSAVAHSGSVRLEPRSERTRIHLRTHYNPPGGALGHGRSAALGADPKRALDEDLIRLKSLLESGRTSLRGHTVTRDALA